MCTFFSKINSVSQMCMYIVHVHVFSFICKLVRCCNSRHEIQYASDTSEISMAHCFVLRFTLALAVHPPESFVYDGESVLTWRLPRNPGIVSHYIFECSGLSVTSNSSCATSLTSRQLTAANSRFITNLSACQELSTISHVSTKSISSRQINLIPKISISSSIYLCNLNSIFSAIYTVEIICISLAKIKQR